MNKTSSFKNKITIPISKEEENIIYQHYQDSSVFEKITINPKRKELVTHGGHYMHQSKRKRSKMFLLG